MIRKRRNIGQPFRIRQIRQPFFFLNMRNGIHPKSVYAFIEPPIDHVINGVSYLLIFPVQVWLLFIKKVEIILACLLIILPSRSSENAFPIVWLFSVFPVLPNIPVAFLGL